MILQKKKPKRQRIESSGSESEPTIDKLKSPCKDKIKEEISESPIKIKTSPGKDDNSVLGKSSNVKTYESPQTKKKKSSLLSEAKRQVSPNTKDSKKVTKKNYSPKIQPSPKPKVKKEVASIEDKHSPVKNKENVEVKQEEKEDCEEETVVKVLGTYYIHA